MRGEAQTLRAIIHGLHRTIQMQGDRIEERDKQLAAMTAARNEACELAVEHVVVARSRAWKRTTRQRITELKAVGR